MNYSKGLMATFELLILLSTLTTLLPYTASALAEIVLQRRDLLSERNKNLKSFFIAIIALAFSLFAIVGSGLEVVAYGLLLLLSGLPIYYWLCTKNLSDSQS